ncbi:cation diffusion facilitator family transporter [Paraburkholderia phenazinium]|uniref:Cobalt-zinc-cadmium efflux system protein n=1 Tax=Paraburkholderia phenazinium TaxID=60549 RepID=A0A1G7VZG3_9BURK|nr:cation diffusion facilitator family transporter [Paraburkholderia phenazinium]SDG65083.1 cobalt-zinc-cadmium efflux system protein [Paraburkholderia phenazinium]
MNKIPRPDTAAEEREDDHAPVWLDGQDGDDAPASEPVADPAQQAGAEHDHAGYDEAGLAHSDGERPSHDHAGHAHAAHEQTAHADDSTGAHKHAGHAGHTHSHADGEDPHEHAEHDGKAGHAHAKGHSHSHSHGQGGHHHHHAPVAGHGRAFAIAIALNIVIVLIQAIYGVIAHSTALLADAGHNLSDVLGLLLAWGATWLTARRPSARYTFGYGSTSILASLANAGLLLFACGVIVAEAIDRLLHPAPVAGLTVFVVATAGMLVNGFSAWLFMRGQKEDLNIRGAFLHMASDALISAAVAISGLVILATSWTWLDPLMSIVVVAVIVYGTWGLLRDSVRLALDAVPPGVDLQRIRDYLAGQPGVTDVHDLHVWALSTTGNALSVHLVMPAGHPGDAIVDAIVLTLREKFAMQHATLQVDLGTTDHHCALDHPHAD